MGVRLTLENVSKSWKEFQLRNISLEIDDKEYFVLLGPTGAGKTTALNAIACLVKPDFKMISVEEVAEINLPQENWVSTIARPGFGADDEGEVTLFDLIKSAAVHEKRF